MDGHAPALLASPPRRTVLIADPRPDHLRPIEEALAREFAVDIARDGGSALERLSTGGYFAAIVSTALPKLSGLETLRRLSELRLKQRPVIVALGQADDVRLNVITSHGLADGVQVLPCPSGILLRRVWHLADREIEARWAGLEPQPRALVQTTRGLLGAAAEAARSGGELAAGIAAAAGRQVVEALETSSLGRVLGDLHAYHDYTYVHSLRVATRLAEFALASGMRRADAELLAQAGLLHDIGKTAVPVEILDKPGPLDRDEWRVMRTHPRVGGDVLRRSTGLAPQLVAITERHHERLDGSGYPFGLAGAAIDEPSLLCAIADVHTALTDRRAYRASMPDADAFAKMRTMLGRELEPALFRTYEQLFRDGPGPLLNRAGSA